MSPIIKPKPLLNDAEWSVKDDIDQLTIRKDQEITDEFLDDLKDRRFNSSHVREKEFMHVASIPTAVVEKWMREGFDILSGKHTAREIVQRLKAENLDAFLATNKRV